MAERRISEAHLTSTVCEYERKTFQRLGTNRGRVYLHSKEFGGAKLYVAAEIAGKHVFVITAFWE